MKQLLLLAILILLSLTPCFAQENLPCPNISVVTREKIYEPASPITFSISPNEDLKNLKLEYKWVVPNRWDMAESGQGTSAFTVSTAGLEYTTITATVEIKGLPQNCPNTFTGIAIVEKLPIHRTTTQEDVYLSQPEIMSAEITKFYTALNNNPTVRGVIITIGKQKDIDKREAEIKRIIKLRKYNIKRVEFIKVVREQAVRNQLIIVLQGEIAPSS